MRSRKRKHTHTLPPITSWSAKHILKRYLWKMMPTKYPSQQQNHPIWKHAKEAWEDLEKNKIKIKIILLYFWLTGRI
jgi:hypothetical protein